MLRQAESVKPLEVYLVGGAVRDGLLGLSGHDRDWVVVGSTEAELLARGFTPVGRDFPVFLHPETHEEYALARRWEGLGAGAWEHSPEISLEEDLACRDLTVNALAERPDGSLVDPFGGRRDLEARVLRHVGDVFVADPLRVLRVARFGAQLSPLGFTVAPETLELMAELAGSGCLDSLVADRVWKELHKALELPEPHPFFELLADCGALEPVFPELARAGLRSKDLPLRALRAAAALGPSPLLRFGALAQALHSDGEDLVTGLCGRVRAPRQYSDLARVAGTVRDRVHSLGQASAEEILDLLKSVDSVRRPERVVLVLDVCEADWRARHPGQEQSYPQRRELERFAEAVRAVPTAHLAGSERSGPEVAADLKQARIAAITRLLGPSGEA